MRQDMAKVLCETYRVGARWSKGLRPRRSRSFNEYFDEVGGKVGVLKTLRISDIESRSFGENLTPLWRFLEKQVNRPWSKVYSEICAVCKKDGAVNSHIFQHIFDYVVPPEKIRFHNGELQHCGGWGNWYTLDVRNGSSWYALYVDPRDGIIKKSPARKPYKSAYENVHDQRAKLKKVIDKYTEYHKIDGIWFRYDLKDVPESETMFVKPADMLYETWKSLTGDERVRYGDLAKVQPNYHDVFKSQLYDSGGKAREVLLAPPSQGTTAAWRQSHSYGAKDPSQRYYAKLSTASKEEKKRHNLE